MLIAVVNESTLFSAVDAQRAVDACARQLRYHAAPAWARTAPAVVLYSSEASVPAGADILVILDNADQAGALGYHDETPSGKPYGRVFVAVSQKAGVSVSSVLSHEVLELFIDPTCSGWEWDGNSTLYAREVGDPVESDSYTIRIHDGALVEVSNFVFPAWFDPQAAQGSRFDQLRNVSAPFSMTANGYVIVMVAGKVSQRFGDEFPEWKKALKTFPAARTARRSAQVADQPQQETGATQ